MAIIDEAVYNIKNSPELMDTFGDMVSKYVKETIGVGEDMLPLGQITFTPDSNLIDLSGGVDAVNQLRTTINGFNTQKLNENDVYDNILQISGIFVQIHQYVIDDDYALSMGSDNNSEDKTINYTYKMYYNHIINLKSIRDDISYNINTANKFLHKLHNYTNTNPNLHLLSKTKDKLQNKINSYEKHMNIDSKMNKEFEKNIENNKKYNYYLIIIYYVILILFFIFSNFMKNKYYKNPIANIMIILYIIAPFIIKYIILYLYKFYLYIMKKFNLLNTGLTYEDIIKYDSYNYENNQDNISYI